MSDARFVWSCHYLLVIVESLDMIRLSQCLLEQMVLVLLTLQSAEVVVS